MEIKTELKARASADETEASPHRSGVFTSGIVSVREGRRVAVFFTGQRHAGENLESLLRQRAAELAPPIQMCDGLARNLPKELKTIVANCIAHGRRKFVNVAEVFPEECRYVLEKLREVYKNDAVTRRDKMSPQERLEYHQCHSKPIMDELEGWLVRELEEKKVEPSSALGEAISYMLKRWEKMTLFLREAGAPLDNNLCERALKKAIMFRKNSLFYKTQKGARAGDILMSLIYTCQLEGTSPFEYLTELQRHAADLEENPSEWMPWNYRERLGRKQGEVKPAQEE